MSDIALVYLIPAAALVLFVSRRVPVGIVAIGRMPPTDPQT